MNMQRKQLRWNECSPIKEALNEGTSQWLKTSSMSEPTHKRMNDKTIELLNEGNKHRIAWKNVYEERTNWANKQEIKELHEMKWTWKQTKRNGIKWNEMEMNLKMKKNMNEWINELMSWWMNELMNERTNI